jgi:carboxypeptidase family protein
VIKHWCTFLAFISLASSTIAVGQVSTPSLTGQVTDSAGRPLRKAGVALLGTAIAVHSDSAGRYVFLDVPSGVYTVRATAIGYVRVDRTSVRVRAGHTTHLDFALGYDSCDLACGGAVIVTTPKDST